MFLLIVRTNMKTVVFIAVFVNIYLSNFIFFATKFPATIVYLFVKLSTMLKRVAQLLIHNNVFNFKCINNMYLKLKMSCKKFYDIFLFISE